MANKNEICDFLSDLEGYHCILKEIHWSTTCKAEHLLTDDIDDKILDYLDDIAEVGMGMLKTRFGIGDLKCMLPNAKALLDVLNELKKDVVEFKGKFDKTEDGGMTNLIDGFLEDIETWRYLATFH